MAEPQFTPGPWIADGNAILTAHGGTYVANLSTPRTVEERVANARLMASSPELLSALEPFAREYRAAGAHHLPDEALLRDVDEFNDITIGDMRRAYEAFIKAGGKL